MSFKPRTWFLLSLVLFIAAWFFWQRGDEWRNTHPQSSSTNSSTANAPKLDTIAKAAAPAAPSVVYPSNLITSGMATNLVHPASSTDYRVSNSTQSFEELAGKDSALLLRNAWIDTAAQKAVAIPAELRATQDPGSYIVQSRGVITAAFRRQLVQAGAAVVSYIPNNAYLVRVTENGAQTLVKSPLVQSVLPYEPFYKLDLAVMPEALGQRGNPSGKTLRLTVFDGQSASATMAVHELGGTIIGQEKTPFGPQLIVKVPLSKDNTIQKLAVSTSVQAIEFYTPRVLMNDLTRQRVRVSTDTITNGNYLGLTGTNIIVNVNDTGAFSGHPDLTNRIFGLATNDSVGHGTHVSGIIASSGEHGPTNNLIPGTNVNVLTFLGSSTNASFRGMAPAASILILPFNADFSDNLDSFSSDAGLAETAARSNMFVFGRTNTLISNNSWGYGAHTYNSSAAIFDGAARDALPDVPGSQPVLFIFAAGNAGGASDPCFPFEHPDSINSPATMKNGIAVGAIENLRVLDQLVISNVVQKVSVLGTNLDLSYTCDNCTLTTNNNFWRPMTDSSNQVAGFSSRGNTGMNTKSIGRFKPDVVAPGSFVISTCPPGTNWNAAAYYNPTNVIDGYRINEIVLNPGKTNSFPPVIVPDNTVRFSFVATPTITFTNDLLIYASTNFDPSLDPTSLVGTNSLIITNITTTNCSGDYWFVDVVNPSSQQCVYDFTARVLATNKGTLLTVLSNLNEGLDPSHLYRFESGTSMAAPVVSGLAALMQEFFEQRLGRTNSPALMKALLINGARSVGSAYHLQTDPSINNQGWGLVNIQNSIPALLNTLSNVADEASWPIRFFEQSPTNALSTGQSHTFNLSVTNELASPSPLRITLVWTDPPGNPAATINLVNDLDLIVTNNDTGEVYFGNNFSGEGDFSDVNLVTSNSVTLSYSGVTNDFINNVENVYINGPVGTNYSITVFARRVNVNAVTANTNDVVQDYALVVATGNSFITNAFTITPALLTADTNPAVTYLNIGTLDNTNSITGNASRGILLESEHVGANPSMLVSTNGTNLQWRFYVVTNATTFTNALFSIFSAPTLSVGGNISDPYAVPQPIGPNSQFPLGRNISADLDLYVSTNSAFTNLETGAVNLALRSVDRYSDESILITDSSPGDIYYIGVKSEDQQAGEFNLGVVFLQANPYSQNPDGSVNIELPFARSEIPDGTPSGPGGIVSMPLPGPSKFQIGAVILQNQFTHERFGDLTGVLRHGSKSAYLNNHNVTIQTVDSGTVSNTYDDIQFLTNTPSNFNTSDGPGDLSEFIGDKASDMWKFIMVDNAPTWTGRVDGVVLTLYAQDTNGLASGTRGKLFSGTVSPGQTRYGALIVPATAVSLTLKVAIPNAGEGPLDLYVRRDDGSSPRLPGPSNYDFYKTILNPGGSLTIGRGDIPPLMAGTYLVAIHCPLTSLTTSFDVFYDMTLDLAGTAPDEEFSTNVVVVQDETFTNSLTSKIPINLKRIVSDVRVGVRIDHPRVSDLVLHLISPSGTSVLLSENRGRDSTNGMGYGTNAGEFAYTTFSEDTNSVIPIKFASSSNYLEFIRPVLLATTVIEDSLAVDPVTISASSGGAAEDFNFIDTGLTNGQIKISYQMFSVPDDIRIYYQGVLLYDSGLVSGSNNLVINYSGASTIVEVVMNEGNNTNSGTAWNYTVSFLAVSLAHENQRSTGVAISGNDMFISGITGASGENGIGARFGLPMQDNSHPIWELNYPELGSTRFNGVAVASDGVYMVGSSVSLTTDTVGAAEPKGIVVKFPLSHPQTNIADVYGSIWHVQTPADPGEFAISGQEELFAVTTTIETTNTFIYTAGVAQANPTNFGRMFISKLDVNGAILWTTNDATSGTTTNYSSGRAITTLNGNIYVAGGNADSGITNTYLVKYDAQGTKVWSRVSTFSGEFGGIAAYGDSIYTVGSAGTDGARSFLVQKWDESGNSIWTNQFSLNGSEDILRCVVGYADRLYAAGSTAINATNRDSVLLELSQETGALITNAAYNGITTYGGGALADDVINGIATDGFDLYLSGETHRFYTNRTDSDALLLRYRIKDDYLPEETLSLFTGEYANGDWRLVIWDNRADQVVSSGKLLSWQLQLTLAPTNNTADVLVHDVPYGATVSSKNPIRYFIVNVPFTATRATVSLTNLSGGGLNLWFDQYGLPLPGTPTRFLLLTNITAAAKNIDDSGSIPTLIPGQRFYLGVEDVGTATQDFLIQVSFDSDATTFMTGGGSAQGSFEAGFTGNNSYQFRINLSDPTMAFQLRNLTGDVDVYLQRGSIPSPSSFTFHRSFTGTNFGQILIEPQGDLSDVSGTWFVSMRNLGTNAVTYSVVLATANRAPVVEGPNDRVVTEGNLLSFIVPVADPDLPAQQMTFSLEPGAPAGASLNSTNGLFSWTPTAAQGPSSNLVTIRVTDNGVPPMTLTRSFSIIVNDKVPVFATPAVVSGKLQVTWSSLTGQNYEVQTSTNLVNWTTVATNSASGSTTTYLDPQPQTNNVNKFYRIHPVP